MIEKYQTTQELVTQFLKKLEEQVKRNSANNPLQFENKEYKPTL
jgi:hypothetical protein